MVTTRQEREAIFQSIYDGHLWGGKSVSGTGSDLEQTGVVREELPKLLERLGITSILDIPCGDMHWMSRVKLPRDVTYIGADIVPALVAQNRERYGAVEGLDFEVLDIVVDKLPKADMVFVRDLFGHLSDKEVQKALDNVKESGAKFLVATTFPKVKENVDIDTGKWRPINIDLFGLKPIMLMNEQLLSESGHDVGKMLGLYRLN